jgi:hypothetical protein
MEKFGVPGMLVPAVIALEFGGGLLIAAGRQARGRLGHLLPHPSAARLVLENWCSFERGEYHVLLP